MGEKIAYLIFDIQCLSIAFAFLVGLFIKIFRNGLNKIWESLLFYHTLLAFIIMLLFYLETHKIININYAFKINNMSLSVNYTILSFYIINHIHGIEIGKKHTLNIVNCIILLLIISTYNSPDVMVTEMKMKGFGLNHIGLILLSILYLIELSKNIPEKSILKLPDFWLVVGVVASAIINFPIMVTIGYLFDLTLDKEILPLVSAIPPLGYFFQYCFISYSFICSLEKVKK